MRAWSRSPCRGDIYLPGPARAASTHAASGRGGPDRAHGHVLDVPDRQLEEPLAHLGERAGIAGRQEAVRALAALGVPDPLAVEGLRDLARGLVRGEDERDGPPEDP